MIKEKLTEENFLIYCARIYDNPQMHSTEEFMEDLQRIKYIKKLVTRYSETNELKERLILNHIITLHNCFGIYLAKVLFLKMETQFTLIKPFLVLLNALPEVIYNVGKHEKIFTDSFPMDQCIIGALRRINNGN